jgi:hypothetical protein
VGSQDARASSTYSKLCTRDNMDHIASHGGRFLTILPKTRKEEETGRAWIASGAVVWEEIARRPGKAKDDPDEVYWAAEAPSCSAEGYRIVWFRSSVKRVNDALSRKDRIEQARADLQDLAGSLSGPRCQLKSCQAVEDDAGKVVASHVAGRWVRFEVADDVVTEFRRSVAAGLGRTPATTSSSRIASPSPLQPTPRRSPSTPPPTAASPCARTTPR